VARYEEPQVRGVLPGGNWRLRKENDASRLGRPVIAFLVYDKYVRPVWGAGKNAVTSRKRR
jgi:hypothetical protein